MIGIEPILIDLQSNTLPLCYTAIFFKVLGSLLLFIYSNSFSTTTRSRTVTLLRLRSS